MTKTIFCTNPTCNSPISFPEGADSVICGKCNTWQLVAMAEESNEPSTPPAESHAPVNPYAPPGEAPAAPPTDPPVAPQPEAPQSFVSPAEQQPPVEPIAAQPEQNMQQPAPQPQPQDHEPVDPAGATKIVGDLGCLVTDSGDRMKLRLGKNTIGRQATDLIINDRTVSRQHCVIEAVANRSNTVDYFVYDIGHDTGRSSSNGVFLSGRTQRLEDFERVQLANGSAINIGNVRLVLTF